MTPSRLPGVARRIVRDTALAEHSVHDACINIWTGAGVGAGQIALCME